MAAYVLTKFDCQPSWQSTPQPKGLVSQVFASSRRVRLPQFHTQAGIATALIGFSDHDKGFLVEKPRWGCPQPLFRPAFLTEKWPAVDYLVELIGVKGMTPIFFAQVKSTVAANAVGQVHAALPPKKRRTLARIPGPTYLVGVQEPTKRVFIRAVNDQAAAGVYAIPVTHELTPPNLQVLYDEVKAFWQQQDFKPRQSAFA
jgi:hypothetical protein